MVLHFNVSLAAEMIRQRLLLLALVISACQFGGCVSIQSASGGRTVYWVVPGMESGERSNRAGTTYYNERWGSDPGSHPAVNGAPKTSIVPEGKMAETGSGSGSSDDTNGSSVSAATIPPVYPPYSTRTSREAAADGQTGGAVMGALIGAQAGNRLAGVAVGVR